MIVLQHSSVFWHFYKILIALRASKLFNHNIYDSYCNAVYFSLCIYILIANIQQQF